MPEKGIDFVQRSDLLSYEEMLRLVGLMASMGINKVRITGGEPFVRKDLMEFLEKLGQIEGITDVHLTTNGTLTHNLIPDLEKIGINSVNLSIDSLDETRFYEITRRKTFKKVMSTFNQLIGSGIRTKLNMVVMGGKNIDDIVEMIELTRDKDISVRFLEEMPFNGVGKRTDIEWWDQKKILGHIKVHYPDLVKLEDPPHSTSSNFRVPGYLGSLGIIASYSRLFCGTCNRIRLTPTGVLKTCLYDNGVFNVRDMIRQGATDDELKTAFLNALSHRAKDGFEAEKNRADFMISESMATIGG